MVTIFFAGLAEFFDLRLVILIVLVLLPFVWWMGKPIMITIKFMIKKVSWSPAMPGQAPGTL